MFRTMIAMFVLLGIAAASLSGCVGLPGVREEKEFRETYTVKSGARLGVSNRNGSVTVSGWDKDQVEVYALLSTNYGTDEFDKVNIKVTTVGDIDVETEYLSRTVRVAVEYEIKVPAGVLVSRVETSNGSIAVEDVKGDVSADSSNGEITIRNVDGTVDAHTSNGSLEIVKVSAIARGETSNGKVTAEVASLAGDMTLKTSNGAIRLYVAAGLNANAEMSTSNGKISLHDVAMTVSQTSRTELQGTLGSGGVRLSVRTSNGDVDVYPLSQ
jgi:hypothetical protein